MTGHEGLMKYGRYGQLQNLLRKDVKDMKRGVILPIHTRFNSLMESGRTSSSSPSRDRRSWKRRSRTLRNTTPTKDMV